MHFDCALKGLYRGSRPAVVVEGLAGIERVVMHPFHFAANHIRRLPDQTRVENIMLVGTVRKAGLARIMKIEDVNPADPN
jgi:hypothetical protein